MLWLMWLKNSDVMLALGVAQWRGSICHQDLLSPLLCLLSWLSFKLTSILTTCFFYSQKRAEATPHQSQIQVPPEKARSQKVPAKALFFSHWLWLGHVLHPKVQRSRMGKDRYTQRATIRIRGKWMSSRRIHWNCNFILLCFPLLGLNKKRCTLSYFSLGAKGFQVFCVLWIGHWLLSYSFDAKSLCRVVFYFEMGVGWEVGSGMRMGNWCC